MFYFFNNPRSSFWDNYLVLVCLVYCVTGIAYAFAIYLEPGPAQLVRFSNSMLHELCYSFVSRCRIPLISISRTPGRKEIFVFCSVKLFFSRKNGIYGALSRDNLTYHRNYSSSLQFSVLLPVVLTLIANQNYQEGILKIIENMCYTKWALEAFVVANAERYGKTALLHMHYIFTQPYPRF